MRSDDLRGFKWIGTAFQIAGAAGLAARVSFLTPLDCYVFMTLSSIAWLGISTAMREWALAALNLSFLAINILGIGRWYP
jgi:hypothetical protein